MEASRHIRGLDGLRTLAITLVFFDHKAHRIGSRFDVGVTLFFILSGYLITGILVKRRALIEAGLSTVCGEIKRFFVSRSFRIFPPYFAMLIILLVIRLMFSNLISFKWLPFYLSYTTNLAIEFVFKMFPPSLGHLWSLAVEEQFYLIAAPLFLLIPVIRAKYAVTGLIGSGFLSFAILLANHMRETGVAVDSFIGFANLGLGSALALTATIANGKRSIVVLAGIAAMIVSINAPDLLHIQEGALADAISIPLSAVFGTIAIRSILFNQNSTVVGVLEWKPVRLIGRISYAFYLWHMTVDFQFLDPALLTWLSAAVAKIIILVLDYGCTLILAIASWWLVEAPMLRWRDKVIAR